jgi:hypothetical protein
MVINFVLNFFSLISVHLKWTLMSEKIKTALLSTLKVLFHVVIKSYMQ